MGSAVKALFLLITTLAVMAPPSPAAAQSATIEAPAVVELKPAAFQYWAAGEFTRDGKPADAPRRSVQTSAPLSIMTHQVSVGEYTRCVADNACPALTDDQTNPDLPAVMVSWTDARAYAAWLSKKLDAHYRLPTDEEWTFAAGSRAPDEATLGNADAIARWLDRYNRESQGQPADTRPQPIGHFGANENGLVDIAGNIWEWTDSCYTRTTLDAAGMAAEPATVNCGVRIAEGRHRAYVVNFIRDPRAGGCAAGIPPSNLGFRLVRDAKRAWTLF